MATTAFLATVALLAFASTAGAAPTATMDATWTPNPPTRPSVGQEITFTVDVTNWDGAAGHVDWSFGDGATAMDMQATEPVTHAYAGRGLKVATVTVTNGEAVPTSTSIFKFIEVNAPPVAAFSWSPFSPSAGADVLFSSESDDPDGAIAEYHWEFGDGVSDERRTPTHPYRTAGSRAVKLTVTDAWGATDSITRTLTVQGPPAPTPTTNKVPIANFAFGPRDPQVGTSIEFVSSSVDPDGDLRSQLWDLDGDGQFDDARGDEVVHTFATAGDKTVRLRVEDANGAAAVRERTVTVRAAPVAPAGFLRPSPVVVLNGDILDNGARVTGLGVRAPRGAMVTVKCRGKSCPVSRRRKRVKQSSVRFRTFERFLRARTKLEIRVTKPNTIGDYTRFTIRAGKRPARIDRCLPPGKKSPIRCR